MRGSWRSTTVRVLAEELRALGGVLSRLHAIPLGPPGADRDQGVVEGSMWGSTALSRREAMRAAKA